MYNSEICDVQPYPYFHYGLILSSVISQIQGGVLKKRNTFLVHVVKLHLLLILDKITRNERKIYK